MNDSIAPVVSVIIPCLNEEEFIGPCIESVLANDYPLDRLEVIAVNGMSDDRTLEILQEYAQRYPFIRVLQNPRRITPAALNIGIKASKGDVIVRLDAHATYSENYVSKCVEHLLIYNVDNVGGVCKFMPRSDTVFAKAIALVLSHPFGVGFAHYRIGIAKEPRYVDTVPFGCFRRELFDRVGMFDEDLPRNEDFDFNQRLTRSGGKILLVPDIVMFYYARTSLREFVKRTFNNGFLITRPLYLKKARFSLRHVVPLMSLLLFVFFTSMAFVAPPLIIPAAMMAALYGLSAVYFSFRAAIREKVPGLLLVMPFAFALLHVTYAIGSLWGLGGVSRKAPANNP